MEKKILVIEDEPHIQKIEKTLLEGDGHKVLVCDNPEEGITRKRPER